MDTLAEVPARVADTERLARQVQVAQAVEAWVGAITSLVACEVMLDVADHGKHRRQIARWWAHQWEYITLPGRVRAEAPWVLFEAMEVVNGT
jgi:hypothetical protein